MTILQPRSDPEISSYWEHDTAASREIARAMAEAEAADRAEDDTAAGDAGDAEGAGSVLKKPMVAMFEDGNPAAGGRARGRPFALSIQLADLLAPSTSDLPALLDGDATLAAGSPPHSQLSPTGLISIAAADIDEASTSPRPGAPRDLDWEFIAALRRRAEGDDSGAERRPSSSRR